MSNLPWFIASTCDNSMYLSTHPEDHNTSVPYILFSTVKESQLPICRNCPPGGRCTGPVIWSQVTSAAGFRPLPWDSRGFGRCMELEACPVIFANQSNSSDQFCAAGNEATFCSQCLPDFTVPLGVGTVCEPCPDFDTNVLTLAIVTGVGTLIIIFLVWDSMDGIAQIVHAENVSEAEMPFHSVGLRILSSYLQVAGLLQNFNFKLPPSVATLVSVQCK